MFKKSIERESGQVLGKVVVRGGDKDVASSGFRFNESEGNLIVGDAKHMFKVKPSHSGKGLGVKIGQEALRLAREEIPPGQIQRVSLTTKKGNTAMQVTATKLGFRVSRQDQKNVYYEMDPQNLADLE